VDMEGKKCVHVYVMQRQYLLKLLQESRERENKGEQCKGWIQV
jgi:hypothetical protein